MKTKFEMRNPVAKRGEGFVLIVTVAILILVSLIAFGILSLSSTTTRSGSAELAQLEAQANARLALMIAIGELQEELGPDQRVSASAGILDENPETVAIEGVDHPNWTVVWSTEWQGESGNRDNKSPWVRNDEEGGLSDRRFEDGYDRLKEVLNYLVSGNEGGREVRGDDWRSALNADLGEQGILVVGPGSVGAGKGGADREVSVPLVAMKGSGRLKGGYAFWVGDLGVKAHVALVDAYSRDSPRRGVGSEGMERLLNAQDVAEELIDGLNALKEDEARRTVSDMSTGLAGEIDKDEMKRAFHDITTWSRSVLVNVRQGGLQRDLTAFLNTQGAIPDLRVGGRVVSQGLSGLDNMIGPANPRVASEQGTTWAATKYREIAPTYDLLRNWARLGRRLEWSARQQDMIVPSAVRDLSMLRGMNNGINVFDGANLRPASFLPFDTPNLFPVMVEGSLFYNLASYPDQPRDPNSEHTLRICYYPRVALWNPYNVALKTGSMVATIFVNGNKEVQITDTSNGRRTAAIPFGRGSTKVGAVASAVDVSPGHYVGWILCNIAPVTIAPGETLVFSPQRRQQYEIAEVFRNTLSPTTAPDPSLYWWQDMVAKHPRRPKEFIEFPGPGNQSGGDNYMMSLKDASSVEGKPTDTNFNNLQSIVYVNCSLQAGGSDEMPVRWSANNPVRVYALRSGRDHLPGSAIPDVRTRDGFRIRWWEEHRSNVLGSGQLQNFPQHLQSSVIGTWNPRAAYFCRTPWDNVSDQPPHFFGMYTRDLFDPAVSWQAMMPRPKEGRMLGNPFGQPLSGADQLVLFDVPRIESDIPSLGYLRHLKLSEFGWHPSYPIGSSLADPRVGRRTTSPVLRTSRERTNHGWNQYLFGWAEGRVSGRGPDYWAMLFRQILFERPTDHFVVYDLSYELNFNLWDNYFLSTGDAIRKREFLENPQENPLPNGRMSLRGSGEGAERDLHDFHRAAFQLLIEGGFNVHSISKEAWKAILASTRDTGYGSEGATPFPRTLDSPEGEWLGAHAEDKEALAGFRSLSEDELEALAEELVREVKERAPFFGLSDFINRRLVESPHGEKGPIEAAISAAGLNATWDTGKYEIDNKDDLPLVAFDHMSDATRLDQTLKPDSVAWGIPGYLTQGDVVQVVGSTLRARSDSFMVRCYGESRDGEGEVRARAWCEAVVQRTPEPVHPDETGLNPLLEGREDFIDFGRRFQVVSFRWLGEGEI